ncbi:MAG: beta-lactamase family protein [Burkholderiales bacterium]|nr:beta-lactamase family protein [Burkholderiales bacterium]
MSRCLTFAQRRPGRCAWHAALMLAALMLTASCASPPEAGPEAAAPAEELLRLAQRHRICGVAVAVIRQRSPQAITTASGCDPAMAVRPDSVFQAASLSKPVFAYAVLKLVQQGRLALDASVLQYLPQGYRHAFDPLQYGPAAQTDEVADPRLGAVTVRMLLQHTAGLPNWASGPLRFEGTPGARWAYSGEGYVLLQRAVEAVMGQPLDVVMQEQVFGPLGMTHSSQRWTPQVALQLLPGTRADGVPRRVVPLRQPVAAFSLYTTVGDYARFLVALLDDPALLAQITDSPVDVDPRLNLSWGLGWGLEQSADGVHLWQWGNNPGYRAFVMARPGSGDGLVMLTNGDGGLKLAEPLVRAAVPGEHKVFRSRFLSGGVMDTLCRVLGLCL